MTTNNTMTIDERYKYLRSQQPRYAQAQTRREKKELLGEMEKVTGLHRKYLTQLMHQDTIKRRPRSRERSKTYGPEVDEVLALVWEALDYICPQRMKPVLVFTAEQLAECGELRLGPKLREQLKAISASTIGRHLPVSPSYRVTRAHKRFQNVHQEEIPIRRIPWDIQEPGHFELDLVHHCGERTEGEYVYTLQVIDVSTSWSGRRATLGRSYVVAVDALHHIFSCLPFPVRQLYPDNGGEFSNEYLLSFLNREYPYLTPYRSRAGQPNDNRFVEQKNHTLVRYFLGDLRFDTVQQTRYLNTLYAMLSDFYNLFQPVMKQIDKY